MTTKRRLIVATTAGAIFLSAIVIIALAWALGFFGKSSPFPFYHLEQTASTHPGYRHTTLTQGNDIYVNDFEEAPLRLIVSEPTPVIGRLGIANAMVCAIPGQPVQAYIAGDVGSEMPAYEPYRHSRHPPFDWRGATFRAMTLAWPGGIRSSVKTTDPALLDEVVRLLRDGTPVTLPGMPLPDASKLGSISMECDQIPGLLFCPAVYIDAKGTVYLAESLMMDSTASPPQFHARWIPASPALLQWMRSSTTGRGAN